MLMLGATVDKKREYSSSPSSSTRKSGISLLISQTVFLGQIFLQLMLMGHFGRQRLIILKCHEARYGSGPLINGRLGQHNLGKDGLLIFLGFQVMDQPLSRSQTLTEPNKKLAAQNLQFNFVKRTHPFSILCVRIVADLRVRSNPQTNFAFILFFSPHSCIILY